MLVLQIWFTTKTLHFVFFNTMYTILKRIWLMMIIIITTWCSRPSTNEKFVLSWQTSEIINTVFSWSDLITSTDTGSSATSTDTQSFGQQITWSDNQIGLPEITQSLTLKTLRDQFAQRWITGITIPPQQQYNKSRFWHQFTITNPKEICSVTQLFGTRDEDGQFLRCQLIQDDVQMIQLRVDRKMLGNNFASLRIIHDEWLVSTPIINDIFFLKDQKKPDPLTGNSRWFVQMSPSQAFLPSRKNKKIFYHQQENSILINGFVDPEQRWDESFSIALYGKADQPLRKLLEWKKFPYEYLDDGKWIPFCRDCNLWDTNSFDRSGNNVEYVIIRAEGDEWAVNDGIKARVVLSGHQRLDEIVFHFFHFPNQQRILKNAQPLINRIKTWTINQDFLID